MIWRFAILCLLSACCLQAADPSILLAGARTDPSRMMGRTKAFNSISLLTAWLAGGETAFTAVVWVRLPRVQGAYLVTYATMWSVDPARATREGGAELPDILPMTSASGTRGWTFSDPHYDTQTMDAGSAAMWQYGCYAVNVETPTPLTVTLAGCERQVAASNGVVQAFNMQGTAADYSLAVSPSNPSATYRIGFGVNPLVHFFGLHAQPGRTAFEAAESEGIILMPIMTNEWVMCATRVRIQDGMTWERMGAFNWGEEWFPPSETTNATTRTAFARDARISMSLMLPISHAASSMVDVYGEKIFPQWLDDDQLRNVRDLDMFEMQRRGFTRWRNDLAQ